MACSAIYFLDSKGKVLLCRNYRGDIDNTVIDNFISEYLLLLQCCVMVTVPDPGLVNDVEDESLVRPLIKTNECTFAYIKVTSSVTTAAVSISSRIWVTIRAVNEASRSFSDQGTFLLGSFLVEILLAQY